MITNKKFNSHENLTVSVFRKRDYHMYRPLGKTNERIVSWERNKKKYVQIFQDFNIFPSDNTELSCKYNYFTGIILQK